MLKINRILLTVLVMLLTFSYSVNADMIEIDSPTVDNDSQIATVTGRINVSVPTEVTILVLNPGYTAAHLDGISDEDFLEVVNYYRQITTDAVGNFTLSFKLKGESDEYKVVANYSGSSKNADDEEVLEFYATKDINKVLEEVNSAGSVVDMQSLIETKYKFLSINISYYNSLSDSNKEAAVTDFIAVKNGKGGFSTPADAAKAFEAQSVFYSICEADDSTEVLTLIENNAISLGLSELNAHEDWEKFSKENKINVCSEIIAQSSLSDINELCTVFSEEVVLEAINSITNWNGLKAIIKNNSNTLSDINLSNLSKYLSAKDTSAVDKRVISSKYTDISDLCRAVNLAIDKYLNNPPPPSGPSDVDISGSPTLPTYVPPIIEADTIEPSADAFPFADMESSSWAKEAVGYLYNAGIINGKSATSFEPESLVTREEFVKMLVVAFGEVDSSVNTEFVDVNPTSWYAPYVFSAFNRGIAVGKDDGAFGIGELITRQDMCVMAYRAAIKLKGFSASNVQNSFADGALISEYAHEGVGSLYSKGIIKGVGNNEFAPLANATRAQAAQLLYQLIKQ